jgi:hypothetical protein
VFGALDEIEAEGKFLAPLFDAALAPGASVRIAPGAKWPAVIAQGAPPAFVLLARGATAGTFVVERVIRIGDVDRRAP